MMKIKTEIEMTPEEAKQMMTPSSTDIDAGVQLYSQWASLVQDSALGFWKASTQPVERGDKNDRKD